MTPDERWTRIENALQAAAELHAENERRHQGLLADRAEINALHKDMLRSQIDLYKSQDKLLSTMDALTQAIIGVSAKVDRVLDLVEKFLLGGSGNGRGR